MRQYYDVYCLLGDEDVLKFIGTEEYHTHKQNRFPAADFAIPIPENEAFMLNNPTIRADFTQRYIETSALYYSGQPGFNELLDRIKAFVQKL